MVITSSIFLSFEIIPKCTGALSMISSTLLARHIITKKKWGDVSLTNKILFAISIVDIIYSFFVSFLSTWMVPRGASHHASLAAGTTATCTAQGFIAVFSMSYFATAYTALAVLYWLIVHNGWTKNQLGQRKISFSFLLPPIFVASCFAVPPLFFGMYNEYLGLKCFLNWYPEDCDKTNIDCIRGSVLGVNVAQNILYGYMLLGNIVVVSFVCLLIWAVYKQEKKFDRYLSKGQEKNRKNTYITAWQGIRFSAAYLVPYVMYYVFFFYDIFAYDADVSTAGDLVMIYYLVIVMPLLGAFNAIFYFYPRYVTYRKQVAEKSCMACLCDVLGIGWCHRNRSDEHVEETSISTPLISEEDVQTLL